MVTRQLPLPGRLNSQPRRDQLQLAKASWGLAEVEGNAADG
jgi:hypothetical protein